MQSKKLKYKKTERVNDTPSYGRKLSPIPVIIGISGGADDVKDSRPWTQDQPANGTFVVPYSSGDAARSIKPVNKNLDYYIKQTGVGEKDCEGAGKQGKQVAGGRKMKKHIKF